MLPGTTYSIAGLLTVGMATLRQELPVQCMATSACLPCGLVAVLVVGPIAHMSELDGALSACGSPGSLACCHFLPLKRRLNGFADGPTVPKAQAFLVLNAAAVRIWERTGNFVTAQRLPFQRSASVRELADWSSWAKTQALCAELAATTAVASEDAAPVSPAGAAIGVQVLPVQRRTARLRGVHGRSQMGPTAKASVELVLATLVTPLPPLAAPHPASRPQNGESGVPAAETAAKSPACAGIRPTVIASTAATAVAARRRSHVALKLSPMLSGLRAGQSSSRAHSPAARRCRSRRSPPGWRQKPRPRAPPGQGC